MKVFPAVHYSMGGLWVDFEKRRATARSKTGSPRNHATNIPGLYAVGEVDYQYHGANRLGANSLLSCIYGGMVTGPGDGELPEEPRRRARSICRRRSSRRPRSASATNYERILKQNQDAKDAENPYLLHEELGEIMLRDCTIERHNGDARQGASRRSTSSTSA